MSHHIGLCGAGTELLEPTKAALLREGFGRKGVSRAYGQRLYLQNKESTTKVNRRPNFTMNAPPSLLKAGLLKSFLMALLTLIIKPLGQAFVKEASPSSHAISAVPRYRETRSKNKSE